MADPHPDRGSLMRRARRALDRGEELPADLRDTIRYSWMRSRLASAPRGRLEAPYVRADTRPDRLMLAANPVLSRFAQQLAGTHVSLVLADRSARVVGRWAADRSALTRLARLSIDDGFVLAEEAAGTNGIGTALEELAPVTIYGEEHYAESLQRLVCVGVPIRNPLTRRVEGVLDLACPTRDASALLLPTALDLGAQIERELTGQAPHRERVVFDEFVARSRSTSSPLVGLSEQYMVTNAAAAELFDPRDQATLWEQAAQSARTGAHVVRELTYASGATGLARCSPIMLGSTVVGVLIEATGGETAPSYAAERSPAGTGSSLPTPSDKRTSSRVDRVSSAVHSKAGMRLERTLLSLAASHQGRILVEGEQGSGRLATVRRIHQITQQDTALVVRPASLAAVHSPNRWLAEIETLLDDDSTSLAVTDIEDLPPRTLRALAELSDRTRPGLLLLTTAARNLSSFRRLFDLVVHVPALRERREDLPDLAYQIIRELGHTGRIGNRAMAALMSHQWPGNLFELHSALESAVAAAGQGDISLVHLGPEFKVGAGGRRPLSRIEAIERDAIVETLAECGGNRVRAAELLGMSRSTLYRRLRLFGLESHRRVL